jgi:(1->4)-alpha-D-glucan 1-alpha-D-glucosylmutase
MSDWRAVYRLQLTPDFGFRAARELVPYLRDLGVSHLYLSPVLQARRGSTHGYDVVDPTRVSGELGGEQELRALCSAGLGVLLDVVPNHMAADERENPYWRERRAEFFDWDAETGWYRRFFTIDELAGVRVEDEAVFEETHRKVLELVSAGLVEGLRVDHPDGLADPRGYLERLRARGVEHVWVEKILEPEERLRDWPVEGTTGYEFANDVTALFVDPAGEEPLSRVYAELTGERRSFAEVAHEAKVELARGDLQREFGRLRRLLDHPGLEEAAASLHVYRTYVEPWSGRVAPEDRDALAAVPDDLRRVLLLEERGHDELVTRFQQTTGPVMAKGVEDTAFYRWFRLTALNEVGGNPGRFSLPVDDFHRANLERAERFPRHLLTTQTHDTKRSGDVRARIAALASYPDEWERFVRRWIGGAPDANEGYLILQTLVGAWPIEPERLEAYAEKALREAKVHTNWAEPDTAWEARTKAWCRELVTAAGDDVEALLQTIRPAAALGSLGSLVLRLTVPGVPDVYQGDELEALSLVDPDNRRPVDWERRRRLLAGLRSGARLTEETAKLHALVRALDLRRRRPDDFAGAYEPVDAGPDVCAFRRGEGVLVAVPLRPSTGCERIFSGSDPVTGVWHDLLPELPIGLYERGR